MVLPRRARARSPRSAPWPRSASRARGWSPTLDTMTPRAGRPVHAPTTLVSTRPAGGADAGQVMLRAVPHRVPRRVRRRPGSRSRPRARWRRWCPCWSLPSLRPSRSACSCPTLHRPRRRLRIVLLAWAASRARRAESLAVARRGSRARDRRGGGGRRGRLGTASLLVPDDDESDRVLLEPAGTTQPVVGRGGHGAARAAPHAPAVQGRGRPDGRRLRLRPLDLYDGAAWMPAEESPGSTATGTFKRVGTDVTALHPGPQRVVRVRYPARLRQRLAADARRADQHRPRLQPAVGPTSATCATTRRPPARSCSAGSTYATSTPSSRCCGTRASPAGRRRASRARSSDSRAGRSSTTTCSPSTAGAAPAGAGAAAGPLPPDPRHGADHRELRPVARQPRPPRCWARNG